jgi:hypothetical protein
MDPERTVEGSDTASDPWRREDVMSIALARIVGPEGGPATGPDAGLPVGGSGLSTTRVSAAIRALAAKTRAATVRNWTAAVARLVTDLRPDLADALVEFLGSPVAITNPLDDMSIGDIGVVYEAILALSDSRSRKQQGQYFTPDDVAEFMARQARRFPSGRWLDPCCGVGNLAWHLAWSMADRADFVAERLSLVDRDPVALKTAIVLLVASFAAHGDSSALAALAARSRPRDFLDPGPLPKHDFVIVNPPYARADQIDRFRTAEARELYAYFLERVATESRGFVAITPASYLGGSKYAPLRAVLAELGGGDVVVFDNVPDTCFRGYKYGSTNTSKTNFVRAAVTVSAPGDVDWRVTPILRWATSSRARMFRGARDRLVPVRRGPDGEWAKVMPGTEEVWDAVSGALVRLGDLLSRHPTEFRLSVASTPRYYVSATRRDLDRGSKHVLHFRTRRDMDRAYLLLNSSLPYWWWRCLDGGVTLSRRTLLSLPVPAALRATPSVVRRLEASEATDVVTKLNAGRHNENVRRPRSLVDQIDAMLLPGIAYDFGAVYSSDMFAKD